MPEYVAVIISTYNAPDLLRLVLAGYGRQTDRNFRIYIADDGSGLETAAVVNAFRASAPIPVEHIWHEDHGFRKAHIHNLVLQRITEPYILLTDGDCIPLPRMVAEHRSGAHRDCFVSGSRILLSERRTRMLASRPDDHITPTLATLIQWRRHHDINRLAPFLPPVYFSSPNRRLAGIRGCHLACWRKDMLAVNGFDETFEGWGREDSDLAARLLHAGIRRRNLRGLPVLHLWHPEILRHRFQENDRILQQCLAEKRVRALRGLAETGAR